MTRSSRRLRDAPPDRSTGSDPLQRAADEAARLLRADGAIVYLMAPDGDALVWAADAGISATPERAWMRSLVVPLGVGMFGTAVADRAVRITVDYPVDTTFAHAWMTDQVVRNAGIRSMVVAPMIVDDERIGALGVYSSQPGVMGEGEATLVRALADHAAASLVAARLLAELDTSRAELARRVDQERTLREITAHLTMLRDPAEVLQRIVDDSRRLLGADDAHLTLLAEGSEFLVPAVLAGDTDEETHRWLAAMEFPLGGGINGLAASERRVIWTREYLADPRIPQAPEDRDVAIRMGLGAMAAAPLRGPHDEVIGTLAISYRDPRDVPLEDQDLLQGLADVAAIAVTNSRLWEDLRASEQRYHYLLTRAPDIAWQTDRAGRFTFLSDAIDRASGRAMDSLIGEHFMTIVHPDSRSVPEEAYRRLSVAPFPEQTYRFFLQDVNGRPVPVEMRAVADVEDEEYRGAHGIIRDLREQVRLEDDLRRQASDLASARERARLAQELHDSVTQALFSMTLTTRSVELLLDRDPDAARQMLGELRELEREALAEMRALIFELRPANLEQDGLVQALRTHAAGIQGRVGLSVRVDCDMSDERASLDVETALYRIAQEALHNVVKHAEASNVAIQLAGGPGLGFRLVVEDDGKGFDPAIVPTGHVGIAGMRARASQIGGELRVTSIVDVGSRVEVTVPPGPPASVGDTPAGS
ncbi:MAG: GAF domain-containing protein [Chloroflexi bacterium]|nr:GAF domain-containing protein [Chloroflexota bacterium]